MVTVVAHHLVEGAELLAQPGLHRFGLVVVPLVELGSVHVADARLSRLLGQFVVRVALGAAYPASTEAGDQIGLRDLDEWGDVHAPALCGESLVEDSRLCGVARKAVEEDAGFGVGLGQTLQQHFDCDAVGNELPAVHETLGGHAQRRTVADGRAEEIAGRDVGQSELLRQDLGLSALSGAGGAEKDHDSTYGRVRAAGGGRHRMKPS